MAKPTGEEGKGVWGREGSCTLGKNLFQHSGLGRPLQSLFLFLSPIVPLSPPLSPSFLLQSTPPPPPPLSPAATSRHAHKIGGQGGKARKTESFTALLFLPAVQRGDEDEGQDEEQGGGGDHHDEGHLGLRHVLEGDGAPGGLGDGLVGQRVRQVVHLKREIAHHCKTIGKSSHACTFVGIIQGIEYVTPNAQMSPMTQKARTDLEWVLSESGWQMATYLTKAIGKRMK